MSELTYTRHGDYLLPDIQLSDPPDAPPLGRYGMMRKAHLRQYRPILYSQLLLSERLFPLCREIDDAAARLATIGDAGVAHVLCYKGCQWRYPKNIGGMGVCGTDEPTRAPPIRGESRERRATI